MPAISRVIEPFVGADRVAVQRLPRRQVPEVGSRTNLPHATTYSSLRNFTGMNHDRSRAPLATQGSPRSDDSTRSSSPLTTVPLFLNPLVAEMLGRARLDQTRRHTLPTVADREHAPTLLPVDR